MAEGLLAAALPHVTVGSAGLDALVGRPADPTACALMAERGVSIDAHRARQLNLDTCQRADLILVMDHEQRRTVEKRYPFASGRVFRLCEAGGHDVPDPYGAPRRLFEQAFSLIDSGARQWADRISRVSSR